MEQINVKSHTDLVDSNRESFLPDIRDFNRDIIATVSNKNVGARAIRTRRRVFQLARTNGFWGKGESMDNEAQQIIFDFYKEIGGNQDELHFASDWFSGASYKVTRKGHGHIDIRRIYIDDYLDSKNESAEKFIKGKLEKLLKMEKSA